MSVAAELDVEKVSDGSGIADVEPLSTAAADVEFTNGCLFSIYEPSG